MYIYIGFQYTDEEEEADDGEVALGKYPMSQDEEKRKQSGMKSLGIGRMPSCIVTTRHCSSSSLVVVVVVVVVAIDF